jgi:SAM-dependent methyltransferase
VSRTDGEGYLLDNRQSEAGARFTALSELFDANTFRHLEQRVGVGRGWKCWEVGAGGPAVAGWLAEQVGPDGRVLATDIDLSWLPADAGFDVLQHDVGVEAPPGDGFDLIHARLLLVHVPAREAALQRLAEALRPGGWLVLEEADPALQPLVCPDEYDDATALANRLKAGFRELMVGRGVDLAYGRTLPRLLRGLGLDDVQADAYFPVTGPACTALERATVGQIRGQLVAAGLATADEIEQHLRNVDSGSLDLATSPLITAWGRKPG